MLVKITQNVVTTRVTSQTSNIRTLASALVTSVAGLRLGQQCIQGIRWQVAVESLDAKAFKFGHSGPVCACVHRIHELRGILGIGADVLVFEHEFLGPDKNTVVKV